MKYKMNKFLSMIFVYIYVFNVTSAGRFECGEHGRFEYCIDKSEISCIVGCHCHPGYYFDTNSKVCEPSSNLIQSRRIFPQQMLPTTTKKFDLTIPTPTTTDIIGIKVDAIAQDTDDLGDWLYNQFFKTIENQVINNTADGATRRRGGSGSKPRNKKHTKHKQEKKSSKKRKHLKRKGKHFRISENDSLFEDFSESSETETDSESGSSSSDSEEDEPSDVSSDHGHRKIIMINKKPRPPLPSFIFLPNHETPFYPPLGLPPPPAIPMFPMVPVPPMLSFPFAVLNCTNGSTSQTPYTTQATTTEPTIMTTGKEPEKNTDSTNNLITVTTDTPNEPVSLDGPEKAKRKKLLRQLQSMMNAKRGPRPENDPINFMNSAPPDLDLFGETNLLDAPMDMNDIQPTPPENVDFKYLTQLIHRKKLNNIDASINGARKIQKNQKPNNSGSVVKDYRRNKQRTSNLDKSDENFYTSLGRQIASLIRTKDTNNVRTDNTNSESPLLTWDRHARSPQKLYRVKNMKNSEDDDLLNLENRVQHFVTTPTVLSLNELENIISIMEKTKSQIIQNKPGIYNDRHTSNKSYNVKLLPHTRNNNYDNIYPAVARKSESLRQIKQTTSRNKIINNPNPNILPNNYYYNMPKYNQRDTIGSAKPVPVPLQSMPNKINMYNQMGRNPSLESVMAYNPIPVSTLQPPPRLLPLSPLNYIKSNNYFSPGIQNNYNIKKAVPLMNPRFLQQIRPSFIQPVYNRNSYF